jgi:hypothetical protein
MKVGPVSRLLGGVVLVGVGLGALALVVNAPKVLRASRPLLRRGLKQGLGAYATLRSAAAEFAEDVEDLIAEAQAELKTPDTPAPDAKAKEA